MVHRVDRARMQTSSHGNSISDEFNNQTGLTLIELLVVMSILAIITALASPAMTSLLPGYRVKSAASEIIAEMRSSRTQAISRNAPVGFIVDVGAQEYFTYNRTPRTWPDSITIEFTSAKVLRINENVGEVRFFPDGSSSGGVVRLSSGSSTIVITVDWFDGQIKRNKE